MDVRRTHLSPRVARFLRKIRVTVFIEDTKALGWASQCGVIFLTFTA